MISRYRIALGNVQMDSLDDDLLILDVGYSAPDFQISPNRAANLPGYDFTDTYYEKQTVTVTFELHIYDTAKRNEACQRVNAWAAGGGILTCNDRDGQQLTDVRCEKFASIESARGWTDPLTLVFATTFNPYWESRTEKTLTLTGTSARGTFAMDGNAGNALMSVDATAAGNVSSFQISAGNTTIKLTGLALTSGSKLVIDYINGRFLRIRADGKSVLAKLNASSSDNLAVRCGISSAVTFTANAKISVTVKARGQWL